jgi:hypothetical protein
MVSVRRVVPVLLLAMAIPAFAAPKASRSSSSRPPRDLHRVGDHSTAYNPPDPATYPPGAHTYTIKRGDTLWALANQFYKNAYLWPQLWEANTWITDAHWIYPGDVLLVEGEATTTTASTSTSSTSTQTTAEAGSPEVGTTPMPEPMRTTTGNNMVIESRPQPLGTEYDVYCYGYVGDPNEPLPNRINSAEDVETRYETGAVSQDISMSDGDLIFIDGGTSTGIVAGETYLVLEPKDFVNHPRTKAPIGRYNDYRGQVRILCADATRARAIVTKSCREIHVGARLKPLPQIPIPLVRVPPLPAFCDANSNKNRGVIISSLGFDEALGEGNLVTINLGKDDAIQPGDFMVVYRDSPNPGQPRQVLGEIGILTTENHTATAKVVEMRRSMTIGDEVEAR